MSSGHSIITTQNQKPLITPELRQAIAILTMATPDLVRYIEKAILENPMLEIREDGDAGEEIHEPEREDFTLDWCAYMAEGGLFDCSFDRSWAESEETFHYGSEQCLAQAPSLQEHLTVQLYLCLPDTRVLEIAKWLIGQIDDEGYLKTDLREARRACSCTAAEVGHALRLIQSFDPPGTGGRNLTECLLIQLQRRGLRTPLMERLIPLFLEDLSGQKLPRIARTLGLTVAEVRARCALIRSLETSPGRLFSRPGEPRYVIPDVVVEKVDNEYVVLVNDCAVPRLAVNQTYHALLESRDACDLDDAIFLESKLGAAIRLIRSVEQRRATLHRVVQLIVQFQSDFLNKGLDYLKPLTLEEIARVVHLHPSTVSRAVANKYMQSPRGVLKLSLFFNARRSTPRSIGVETRN